MGLLGSRTMVLQQGHRPRDMVVCITSPDSGRGQVRMRILALRNPQTWRIFPATGADSVGGLRLSKEMCHFGGSSSGSSSGDGRAVVCVGPERNGECVYGRRSSLLGTAVPGSQECVESHETNLRVQGIKGVGGRHIDEGAGALIGAGTSTDWSGFCFSLPSSWGAGLMVRLTCGSSPDLAWLREKILWF